MYKKLLFTYIVMNLQLYVVTYMSWLIQMSNKVLHIHHCKDLSNNKIPIVLVENKLLFSDYLMLEYRKAYQFYCLLSESQAPQLFVA